jgi:hypothetical protein
VRLTLWGLSTAHCWASVRPFTSAHTIEACSRSPSRSHHTRVDGCFCSRRVGQGTRHPDGWASIVTGNCADCSKREDTRSSDSLPAKDTTRTVRGGYTEESLAGGPTKKTSIGLGCSPMAFVSTYERSVPATPCTREPKAVSRPCNLSYEVLNGRPARVGTGIIRLHRQSCHRRLTGELPHLIERAQL